MLMVSGHQLSTIVNDLGGDGIKGNGNDDVETEKHGALEIIRLAVLDGVGDDENRDSKCNSFKGLKVESHGHIDDPADDDEEGSHEESNLNAGANRDAHGQIHLVAESNNNSGYMLGCIADNGDENKADKGLADMSAFHDGIDAADKIFDLDALAFLLVVEAPLPFLKPLTPPLYGYLGTST
jgi:hypothetical protein